MDWFATAPIPSVKLNQEGFGYPAEKAVQSFANVHSEDVHMLPGSIHVAVGFADLGSLAAAISKWARDDEQGHWVPRPIETLREASQQDVAAPSNGHEQAFQLLRQAGLGGTRGHSPASSSSSSIPPSNASSDQVSFKTSSGPSSSSDSAILSPTSMSSSSDAGMLSQSTTSSSRSSGTAITIHTSSSSSSRAALASSPHVPLLWAGYDASAYAVAKAAVLVEMMSQAVHEDHILQVGRTSMGSLIRSISCRVRQSQKYFYDGRWITISVEAI
jgi:hypothetical protein